MAHIDAKIDSIVQIMDLGISSYLCPVLDIKQLKDNSKFVKLTLQCALDPDNANNQNILPKKAEDLINKDHVKIDILEINNLDNLTSEVLFDIEYNSLTPSNDTRLKLSMPTTFFAYLHDSVPIILKSQLLEFDYEYRPKSLANTSEISVQLKNKVPIDNKLELCLYYSKVLNIEPKGKEKDWKKLISAYFLEKSWKAPDDYKVAISHIDNHDNCAAIELTYEANDNPIIPFINKKFAINLRFINNDRIKVDFSTIVIIDQPLETPYINQREALKANKIYTSTLQYLQIISISSIKLYEIVLDLLNSSCTVWMMQFYQVNINEDFRNALNIFGYESQNGVSGPLINMYYTESPPNSNTPLPYFYFDIGPSSLGLVLCLAIFVWFYYGLHMSKVNHYDEIKRNLKKSKCMIPNADSVQEENKSMAKSEMRLQKLTHQGKKSKIRQLVENYGIDIKRMLVTYSVKKFLSAYDVISILIITAGKPALNSCIWISVANFIASTAVFIVIVTVAVRMIDHLKIHRLSPNRTKKKTKAKKSLFFNVYTSNEYYTSTIVELESYHTALYVHGETMKTGYAKTLFAEIFFYISVLNICIFRNYPTIALGCNIIVYFYKAVFLFMNTNNKLFKCLLNCISWISCGIAHVCLFLLSINQNYSRSFTTDQYNAVNTLGQVSVYIFQILEIVNFAIKIITRIFWIETD